VQRTCRNRDVEAEVIVDYLVIPDGHERGIRYKDSLEVGVLDSEPGHYDLAHVVIRSVNTIDINTVG
jgi:hypothetical protein